MGAFSSSSNKTDEGSSQSKFQQQLKHNNDASQTWRKNIMGSDIVTNSKQRHTAYIDKQNMLETRPDEITLEQPPSIAGPSIDGPTLRTTRDSNVVIPTFNVDLDSSKCFNICTFENIVYITDSHYGEVRCFDIENGAFLGSITLSSASKDLTGIAVLRLSKTELVMVVGDNIKRQLVACKLLTPTSIDTNESHIEYHFGSFKEICGLATDFTSRVFVADVAQGTILIYGMDEGLKFKLIYEISEQLDFPWYICYDGLNDRLFVSEPPERRITVFTDNGDNGEFLFQLSHTDLGLTQPYGVAVDAAGALLVTDRQEHLVVKLTNNCDAVEQLQIANDCKTRSRMFNGPFDICVTQNGQIVVLDFNGSRNQYKRIQSFQFGDCTDSTDENEIKIGREYTRESSCSCLVDMDEQTVR